MHTLVLVRLLISPMKELLTMNKSPLNEHSEEEKIAYFYNYDFAMNPPELLLTRGQNQWVHSCPLYAWARPYSIPLFIHQKCHLFYHRQPYTPLIDIALDWEQDATLRTEVHCFQWTVSQVEDQSAHLALIHQQFNEIWHSAQQSLDHLARADAYNCLIQPVLQTTPKVDILPRRIVEEGLATWTDPKMTKLQWAYDQCDWCHCQSHPAHQCHMILCCLFCRNNGHPKSACTNPTPLLSSWRRVSHFLRLSLLSLSQLPCPLRTSTGG